MAIRTDNILTSNSPAVSQVALAPPVNAVPEPDDNNILSTLLALKQAVDILNGVNGDTRNNAVLYQDLEKLGWLTIRDINNTIVNRLSGILNVEDWHEIGATGEPGFENSWVNFGGANAVAAFYKDPFYRVHIKGAVKTGTSGTVAYTLPEGYRPSERIQNLIIQNTAAAGSWVMIDTDGTVTITGTGVSVYAEINLNFRVT